MSNAFFARPSPVRQWSSARSLIVLTAATLACLLPFANRAFHIDDPLFLWCGQQIVKHPLNPFGFQVNSDGHMQAMSDITKNPPLACYYIALIGSVAGFSEPALHLGFLLPALAVVLGTYRLARRFTRSPLIAAAATLLSPGLLVSACSVMCDVVMLSFWMWAVIFWMEGLDGRKHAYLFASVVLISASALSKYFGICLVALLFAYSIAKERRVGSWAAYLLLPVAVLAGYEMWTHALYGHGLFRSAAEYAPQRVRNSRVRALLYPVVCASFIGGCALPAVVMAPLVWSRKAIVITLLAEGVAIVTGFHFLRPYLEASRGTMVLAQHWHTTGWELGLFVAGGISALALAAFDLWRHRDAESRLLALWVFGTFAFTAFINWTINARSVLPLIPAIGILLARRIDAKRSASAVALNAKVAIALGLSGVVTMWAMFADANMANNARVAAQLLIVQTKGAPGARWFQGRCDFQYYTEQAGVHVFDLDRTTLQPRDVLVVPPEEYNPNIPPRQFVSSVDVLELPSLQPLATFNAAMGAGFYYSSYGPLPYAFGRVSPQRYAVYHIGARLRPADWPKSQP